MNDEEYRKWYSELIEQHRNDEKNKKIDIIDMYKERYSYCYNEECRNKLRDSHKAMENPPEGCYMNTSSKTKELGWCFCTATMQKQDTYEIGPGAFLTTYKCPFCGESKDIIHG